MLNYRSFGEFDLFGLISLYWTEITQNLVLKKQLLLLLLSLCLIGSANAISSNAYDSAYSAYEDGDYQTAFKGFLVLGKTGNKGAQGWLGYMYEMGQGVTQDYKQAVSWYQKAADQGDAYGQVKLGDMYQSGKGVTQDYKQAVSWFRKAADQGDDYGQGWLGYMYEKGRGVTQDYKQAVSWFRKAANQGDAYGQGKLGDMYESGKGVTQDYKQAVSWFRKAADQEDHRAQEWLGYMYEMGRGVTQDDKQAVSWYQKAADQGNKYAQNNLGMMYEDGKGVTQDYKQAVSWYRKAADQGYEYAQKNLGEMYQSGKGVTKDLKQAVSWFLKAANQGNEYAQKNLGEMYEDGKGVAQNDKLALSWYRKAANQGNSIAKKNLKALELKINNKKAETNAIISTDEYASVDGLTCESGYIKIGNFCRENIENGYWTYDGSTMKCYTGYKKVGTSCKKDLEIMTLDNDGAVMSSNSPLEDHIVEVEFWSSVKDSDDAEEYLIYLEEYPEGNFVKLAELRIKKLSTPPITDGQISIPKLDYGSYHALVIGNDSYKHLKTLSNAVNDANDVASLLRSKYKFNVNVLTNATRAEIVSALFNLRKTISAKDNILIYYAGHGWLDKDVDEGFWLPIDADADDQVYWIANDTIMRNIRAMKAKHVIVVADSCFSGTLIRGIKIREQSSDYLKEIVEKKARTVLTSGGLEPVSDIGGGNNSVFAAAFIRILNENTGVLDGHQLFTKLRKQVMMNTDGQTPEYGDIRKAGHDGGDFLFVRQ